MVAGINQNSAPAPFPWLFPLLRRRQWSGWAPLERSHWLCASGHLNRLWFSPSPVDAADQSLRSQHLLMQGPGATWRCEGVDLCVAWTASVAPPPWRVTPSDTWVARELDVATVRDDHSPVTAGLLWQLMPPCFPMAWPCPIIHRAACVECKAPKQFRHKLSLVASPPAGTHK